MYRPDAGGLAPIKSCTVAILGASPFKLLSTVTLWRVCLFAMLLRLVK
jgi:hypothetical protein